MQKEETQVIRNGRNGVKQDDIHLEESGGGSAGGGAHHDEVTIFELPKCEYKYIR
jgi:hypothetical protein